MKMPGPVAVRVASPVASSWPSARTEIVALPGATESGTMKLTWEAFAATICAATPATSTWSGTGEKVPNAEATDPGAMPWSDRKLAPLTVMTSPEGAAGAPLNRARMAAITGSKRAK